LIGLTSLRINGQLLVTPELNRRRALFVLGKIDQILAWEQAADLERDRYFVEHQTISGCRSASIGQNGSRRDSVRAEFLEKKFPQSRRKAYYLMAVHERLTRVPKKAFGTGGLDQGQGIGASGT